MVNYRRVMLKISGEALMGDRDFGIDPDTISQVAQQIAKASQKDLSLIHI